MVKFIYKADNLILKMWGINSEGELGNSKRILTEQ